MKRIIIGVSLTALAIMFILVGCGKKTKSDMTTTTTTTKATTTTTDGNLEDKITSEFDKLTTIMDD